MVADNLSEVVYYLKLIFCFCKRAVATVNIQGVSEFHGCAARTRYIEGWHTGGNSIVQIESGDAGLRCRLSSITAGNFVDVVAVEAESKLIDQLWIEDMGVSQREALVVNVGDSGIVGAYLFTV